MEEQAKGEKEESGAASQNSDSKVSEITLTLSTQKSVSVYIKE